MRALKDGSCRVASAQFVAELAQIIIGRWLITLELSELWLDSGLPKY